MFSTNVYVFYWVVARVHKRKLVSGLLQHHRQEAMSGLIDGSGPEDRWRQVNPEHFIYAFSLPSLPHTFITVPPVAQAKHLHIAWLLSLSHSPLPVMSAPPPKCTPSPSLSTCTTNTLTKSESLATGSLVS